MSPWRHSPFLTSDERLGVLQLLNQLEGVLGRAPIDESARRMVLHERSASYWLLEDGGELAGFALVSGEYPAVGEMAGGGFDSDLISSVIQFHPHLHWWVRDDQSESRGVPVRTLLMMSTLLNTEYPDNSGPLQIRPFNLDLDLDEWLENNNAAFAHHPEQGAWNRQDLLDRLAEPWFDPSGFLVVNNGEKMVASVWTKIHELHPSREGEIYVLWVSPSEQGNGLGAITLTAGLRNLQLKGASKTILFVEETNDGARNLYESFGFSVQRRDQMILFER